MDWRSGTGFYKKSSQPIPAKNLEVNGLRSLFCNKRKASDESVIYRSAEIKDSNGSCEKNSLELENVELEAFKNEFQRNF